MTMETSAEAYYKIVGDGLLGKLQLDAYRAVIDFGPGTANEIRDRFGKAIGPANFARLNNLDKRLSELARLGVIERIEKRYCQISRLMRCTVWSVTGRLPGKPVVVRLKSRKKLMDEIMALNMENTKLRDMLKKFAERAVAGPPLVVKEPA